MDERSSESVADICYSKSDDDGNTWSEDFRITSTSILTKHGNSGMPDINSDSHGNLYLTWKTSNYTVENDTWNVTSNDLYFTYSASGGELWGDIVRLTHATGWSRNCPQLDVDSNGNIHIVWGDGRNSESMEIYYKRTLNPVTEPPIIVTQTLNVSTCKPGNSVTVSGTAKWNNTTVINANVSVKIIETDTEWNTQTDSNGNYSLMITAPAAPGNYTIRVAVTLGNLTGTKYARLTVESETVTNGGVTDGGAEEGFKIVYLAIVSAIACGIIVAFALLRFRKPEVAKVEKPKEERKFDIEFPSRIQMMTLKCPECKMTFSVEVKPKPFGVKCPNCGKEGMIK
jgi:DNA-directed RNA polymerase subunit RPC12/RpoP